MAASIPLGKALIGAAGATAAAAYLNAKYHVSHDVAGLAFGPTSPSLILYMIRRIRADKLLTFTVFEEHAQNPKQASNVFLWFEGKEWTYAEFYQRTIGVANWLLNDLGIKKHEIVALYGGNNPEYLLLWLALDAIGACPSFLNCNLTGASLMHCIKICDCRYLLCDEDVLSNVEPSSAELQSINVDIVRYSDEILSKFVDQTPVPQERQTNWPPESLKGLLYTSGTTGLPKAINFLAARELITGRLVKNYLRLKPSDRFYTCMPLYHGAAHGLLVTPAIHAGCTIALGRKFSHKTFWPEVRESKANIVQYVGELCRYLLNAPPSPLDKEHSVEMVWGNGMRPDVWEPFRERFGIPVINELYAATDGLGASFQRNDGPFSRHSIAKRGLLWRMTVGRNEKRVKIDVDTQEIVRDDKGHAIECDWNEPGEVIHRLNPKAPIFPSYYKNDAANKRLLRNLFREGDLWFRSGDMHRMDRDGRVYFVDRLGDTFRWKSENVSTNEVSDTLGKWPQIAEVNVYGVQVPRADGRCGCAAVVLADGVSEESLDLKGLARYMLDSLPRYAVPIFLRVSKSLEYTGTLKLQKGRLRREGIELEKITDDDHFYWLPADAEEYRPFDKSDLELLRGGQARL